MGFDFVSTIRVRSDGMYSITIPAEDVRKHEARKDAKVRVHVDYILEEKPNGKGS